MGIIILLNIFQTVRTVFFKLTESVLILISFDFRHISSNGSDFIFPHFHLPICFHKFHRFEIVQCKGLWGYFILNVIHSLIGLIPGKILIWTIWILSKLWSLIWRHTSRYLSIFWALFVLFIKIQRIYSKLFDIFGWVCGWRKLNWVIGV